MTNLSPELIKKLKQIKELSSTERGATQAEAENAAAMLSRLLLEYNIESIDLSDEDRVSGVTHDVIDEGDISLWKQALLTELANNNFCKILSFSPGEDFKVSTAFIVGETHNIVIVREMYAWLSDEFPRIAAGELERAKYWQPEEIPEDEAREVTFGLYLQRRNKDYLMEQSQELAWHDPQQWQDSFMYGMAQGLGRKLERERKNHALSTASFLMPTMDKEVMDYIKEKFPVEHVDVNAKSNPILHMGREKGMDLPTEKQVYGAESTLELGE